jgi:hypothetical protein
MRIGLKYLTPILAAGAVVAGFAGTPRAAADSEICTNLNTAATKCQKPGNVEVNDSLSHANTTSPWYAQGGYTGGPYFGTLGGGAR